MKIFLASICAFTCFCGEPAKAVPYGNPYYGQSYSQDQENRLKAIEDRQDELWWQNELQQFNQPQTIYQGGF